MLNVIHGKISQERDRFTTVCGDRLIVQVNLRQAEKLQKQAH
jgi:hypothetical protein